MSSLTCPERPNWQSVRARAAYGLDAIQQLSRLCPGHLQESAIFLVVARVCLPDWLDAQGQLCRPAALTHFVNAHSISKSLNRPFETVRRHIAWLVDHALLCVEDRKVMLSPESRWADIVDFLQTRHHAFVTFAERLAETDDMLPLPIPATTPTCLFAPVLGTALDLDLIPFEFNPSLHEHLERTAMYAGFAHLGTRHVLENAELATRYRDINTPDAERVAISIRRVADFVGVPYTTAHRQTMLLLEAGLLSRHDRQRLTVVTSDLLQQELNQASIQYFTYLRTRMERLVRLGFRPRGSAVRGSACVSRQAPHGLIADQGI